MDSVGLSTITVSFSNRCVYLANLHKKFGGTSPFPGRSGHCLICDMFITKALTYQVKLLSWFAVKGATSQALLRLSYLF
jgi:hypothetical protein